MDYRKLCVELFGTDDEATLRKIAAEYRKKNTRNAGRKRKIADEDIHKMRAMRNAGTSMQELARTFGLSRQTVERSRKKFSKSFQVGCSSTPNARCRMSSVLFWMTTFWSRKSTSITVQGCLLNI